MKNAFLVFPIVKMWGWSSKKIFFFKSHDILFLEFNTNVIEHWHDQRFIWTISKYINVHVYMNINVLRKHGWVNEWIFFCLKKVGKVTDFFDEWAIGITFYSHYRCTFTVMRDRWFVDYKKKNSKQNNEIFKTVQIFLSECGRFTKMVKFIM